MNYISHYFLDASAGKPYFNFGLVLPDMLGSSQRGTKPANNPLFTETEHIQLGEGIKLHHAADAVFHSSQFFKDNTVQIRRFFEANELTQPGTKLFFAAHIFLEFMLDRLIIQHYEETAKHFYEDIDMVEDATLSTYLQKVSMPADNLLVFLNGFRQHRYLYSYLQNERLFYALNRTLQRAGQIPFPDDRINNFYNVIVETENLLSPSYEIFFHNMRNGKI